MLCDASSDERPTHAARTHGVLVGGEFGQDGRVDAGIDWWVEICVRRNRSEMTKIMT